MSLLFLPYLPACALMFSQVRKDDFGFPTVDVLLCWGVLLLNFVGWSLVYIYMDSVFSGGKNVFFCFCKKPQRQFHKEGIELEGLTKIICGEEIVKPLSLTI